MDKGKKKALEAGGWRVGTVQEFLELSDQENAIVELRVALALRVRKRRAELGLTQEQFAKLIKSSQSRVAKLEVGAATVSLDLMFRSFIAAGGKIDLTALLGSTEASSPRPSPGTITQSKPAKVKAKKIVAASEQ
jgi:transcriptional regulator with XRE-family HTH domain